MPTIANVSDEEPIASSWGNDVADTLNDECAKWDITDEIVTSPDGSMMIGGQMPAIVMARNSSLSIADNTPTAITYTDEVYNVGGFSTPTTSITIPAGCGGLYMITYNGLWGSHATGSRSLSVQIGSNGSVPAPDQFGQTAPATTAFGNWVHVSRTVRLVAGAVVTAIARHTAGESLNLEEAEFSVVMLRHIA